MGWFSSLFSSAPASSSTSARRNLAMSTHDAFSLPTASPLTADSHSRPRVDSPDTESATPSMYAYPPVTSSPTKHDYPSSANGRLTGGMSRSTFLLPLHRQASVSSLPPYPPLDQTWARIRNWLVKEYPELGDTLNWGILPQDLNEIEVSLGCRLPAVVQESYLVVDGQEAESAAGCSEGLFFGLTFLPLEDVLEEWRFWREVDDDPATGANIRLREIMQSIPKGFVRRTYSQRGWIPLVTDKGGNYLGVDLNPDEGGSVGQVIVFGRDFDTKVVMWKGAGPAGWAHWLAIFADELESREGFEVGVISDGSDGSDDGVGYESYFDNGGSKANTGGELTGLRLTGEYRGWNVLEAWADRSVKRWQRAGALPMRDATTQFSTKYGLGVIGEGINRDEGVEVEVPSSLDTDSQKTPTNALSNVTNRPTHKAGPSLASKAPAPRPLYLPQASDIQMSSPSGSRTPSFDHDLESGRQLSFDEVEIPLNAMPSPSQVTTPVSRVRGHSRQPSSLKEAVLVALPPSDDTLPAPDQSIPDLLQGDVSPEMKIQPIEPSPTSVDASSLAAASSSSSTATVVAPEDLSSSTKQSVRLIGGDEIAGVMTDKADSSQDTQLEMDSLETSTVASDASHSSSTISSVPKAVSSKHEKKKSFSSGLKRISILASNSKRRTNSKDTVPAAS